MGKVKRQMDYSFEMLPEKRLLQHILDFLNTFRSEIELPDHQKVLIAFKMVNSLNGINQLNFCVYDRDTAFHRYIELMLQFTSQIPIPFDRLLPNCNSLCGPVFQVRISGANQIPAVRSSRFFR